MQCFIGALYILLAVTGMLLIKYGASDSAHTFLKISGLNISVSNELLLGIFCYGISFLLFVFVISKSKISIMIPVLSGLINVVVVIASIVIFKEQVIKQQMAGVFLIIVGVLLIGISKA